MANRLDLHNEFIDILGTASEEDKRVYFQPPASVKMKYDCIKYSLSGVDHKRANDKIYGNVNRYEVIYIGYDPDSDVHDKILEHFQMCSFDRAYTADNLNHKVYTIYY